MSLFHGDSATYLGGEKQSKGSRPNHHENNHKTDDRDKDEISLAQQFERRGLRHQENDGLNQYAHREKSPIITVT